MCCNQENSSRGTTNPPILERSCCCKCKKTICRGVERMHCKNCDKESHKGCTGLTRDAYQSLINNDAWTCEKCDSSTIPGPNTIPTDQSTDGAGPKKTGPKRNLRGLQWNADGINTKVTELNRLVVELDVDVVLIQETKLTSRSKTPKIHGFTAVRQDRPNAEFPGGGLLTYVRQDLAFRRIGGTKNGNTEALSISIQQKVGKWLDVTNVYSPPRADEARIDWIPVSDNCVIAGDFNGHSGIWDPFQPEDTMGNKIVDFMLANDLICCNDGSHTRVSRVTGGTSVPDITLTSKNLVNNVKWNSINEMGSDHLPVVFEISNEKSKTIPMPKKSTMRWRRKKVDWTAFTTEIEKKFNGTYRRKDNLHRRVENFNKVLIDAGWSHVRKTQPKRKKQLLSPTVKSAIKSRNRMREEINCKRAELIRACQEVTEMIAEEKETWTIWNLTLKAKV